MQTHAIIRRAALADVPDMLELVEEYWRFEKIAGFEASRIASQLQRLLGEPRLGGAWMAFDGETPVGYLLAVYVFSLEHLGLTAEIDELFVRSRARGMGLGTRMLRAAEEAFKAAGCTNVSLQLAHGNEAGRGFYLSRGYTPRSGYALLEKTLEPEATEELTGTPVAGPA